MSQQSYLVWHTTARNLQYRALLQGLPAAIGMERADLVFRDGQHIATDVLASELFKLYVPGTCLHIHADDAKLGARVESAIRDSVPEVVRGDFIPNRSIVSVGDDHFVDDANDNETEVRHTALVGCWGYSTPEDLDGMRSALLRIPAIHAEKVRLEHLMGDLTQALYLKF